MSCSVGIVALPWAHVRFTLFTTHSVQSVTRFYNTDFTYPFIFMALFHDLHKKIGFYKPIFPFPEILGIKSINNSRFCTDFPVPRRFGITSVNLSHFLSARIKTQYSREMGYNSYLFDRKVGVDWKKPCRAPCQAQRASAARPLCEHRVRLSTPSTRAISASGTYLHGK